MVAESVHHMIATLQREVEALRSAATNPAQSQGVLLEALGAFRSMLAELHGAEAALRDSEACSTAILQTAVDGIITIDEHDLIASFNPAAERLFGYTAAEVVGRKPLRLPAACSGGNELETRVQERTAALQQANGQLRAEIAERQRLAQEMQRADRLALVGQLASGLAHEIGTPLNIIAGNAELLGMELRERGLGATEVDAILQHADRITRLIQQLLTFARTREQPTAPLAVQEPLANALCLVEARFTHQGITVIQDVPAVLPRIRGRAEQLEQVFLNVLVNAWHAMPGGGTLTIAAGETTDQVAAGRSPDVAAGRSPAKVRLSFQDTGLGMSAAVLARVFEPFYTTRGEHGTGLGLAICKQIIDSHQGTIHLESTPGVGTTVMIEFPQVDSPAVPPRSLP